MGDTETGKGHAPRIYVASLADYTAGGLLGRWIDATQDAERVRAEIAEMLAESKEPFAEEWAIHDCDGFGPLRLEEYENIEEVTSAAKMITEHGTVFAALLNHFGGLEYLEDAGAAMVDGYCGEFESVADYAQELMEEIYSDVLTKLPDVLRYNIDWEAIGRDLELGGDVFTVEVEYRFHIFNPNL